MSRSLSFIWQFTSKFPIHTRRRHSEVFRSSSGAVLSVNVFKTWPFTSKCMPKLPIHTKDDTVRFASNSVISVNVFKTGSERSYIQQFLLSNLLRKGKKHIQTRAVTSYISPEFSRLFLPSVPSWLFSKHLRLIHLRRYTELSLSPS